MKSKTRKRATPAGSCSPIAAFRTPNSAKRRDRFCAISYGSRKEVFYEKEISKFMLSPHIRME